MNWYEIIGGESDREGQRVACFEQVAEHDWTHWIDWNDGYWVYEPDQSGEFFLVDQAIAYPVEKVE